MMTTTEILNEIKRLPLSEKQEVFKVLETELKPLNEASEEEMLEQKVDKLLLEKGLIRYIPTAWNDDDDFEPIEVFGKPLSETIIEDRG